MTSAAVEIRYEHPERLRTPGAAARELANLKHGLSRAALRGDQRAARYLSARITRLQRAIRRVGYDLTEDARRF